MLNVQEIFDRWNGAEEFSGVFSVRKPGEVVFETACGYRNISEGLKNKTDTKFGTASGTKIFTAAAICLLIQQGKLTLADKVLDILDADFSYFSREITVQHLLTHMSGVPDYFDEEVNDDFEAVWKDLPVYRVTELSHFLPMFANLPMRFEPGQKFSYCNSGYIMLGLIIEEITGRCFQDFVSGSILQPCGLSNTGFFRSDMLPGNTALGYIYDEGLKGRRTNIYSLPVIGASDGGLYTNAQDMIKFWTCLSTGGILSEEITAKMLSPLVQAGEKSDYGLGVYLPKVTRGESFYVLGWDPGVLFFSAYYPKTGITATAFANTGVNIFPLLAELNKQHGHIAAPHE